MDSWNQIQERTFLRWMNRHLASREMSIEKITDLKDGVLLCHLIEIISEKEVVGFHNHPKGVHHELDNCCLAVAFLQSEGIKLVNIGGQDIHDGNVRICLGLIWTLILRYLICKNSAGGAVATGNAAAKADLLEWVNGKLGGEYHIHNLTTDWNDGRAICALTNALRPGVCDVASLDPANSTANCQLGVGLAESLFGIPKLILGEEMQLAQVDEQAMMTYLSQFRDIASSSDISKLVKASGIGLVSGVKFRPCSFNVSVPSECSGQLKVVAEGKTTLANAHVVDNGQGQFSVGYVPGEEGMFTVSVTLNESHIPGSPFLVPISGGGVRVFFSAAKSGTKEALLKTERGVPHNQFEDFASWAPVDVMKPEHLDATIANTRGKVRAVLVVLDDDEAMNSVHLALNNLVKLAKVEANPSSRAWSASDFSNSWQVADELPPPVPGDSITIHTAQHLLSPKRKRENEFSG